ncbi:outer membrane lipoprotein SlyB [Oxalobacteraceae bacterium GrIS 1.11]
MKTTHTIGTIMLAAALSACASYNPQQAPVPYETARQPDQRPNEGRHGTVESIQLVRGENRGSSGVGAVVGGIAGALLGNQVGGGSGRTVATVAGAVGGAVVGNNVEHNNQAQPGDRYQIHVRLNNGDGMTVVQDGIGDLRTGDRVRVAEGRAFRD